ncbi:hypothetical protein E2C01_007997 [Portunus trituberculatus]|uniref:Uncharacterized protein n=1 Tax=Portunus trituberculatus TaxID=210409 RepID=A0A5B7CZM5_PORTR|nr:hypothetical protein [Portunus trituberculatus]
MDEAAVRPAPCHLVWECSSYSSSRVSRPGQGDAQLITRQELEKNLRLRRPCITAAATSAPADPAAPAAARLRKGEEITDKQKHLANKTLSIAAFLRLALPRASQVAMRLLPLSCRRLERSPVICQVPHILPHVSTNPLPPLARRPL